MQLIQVKIGHSMVSLVYQLRRKTPRISDGDIRRSPSGESLRHERKEDLHAPVVQIPAVS